METVETIPVVFPSGNTLTLTLPPASISPALKIYLHGTETLTIVGAGGYDIVITKKVDHATA